MEIMNTTENAPSAKKLQMIINSGISKNSINELHLKAIPRILTVLESILKGCELRFEHLGVHRMSLVVSNLTRKTFLYP